jgi:cytochrome c oxidase assembly protein subunit 15
MDGRVFPENPFFHAPWWINFFNNPGLAQFDHRIGAYIVGALAAWIFARGIRMRGYAKTSAKLVAAIVTFQIALGITMLVLVVPEALAALHQVTAACLFCAAIWHLYEARNHAGIARVSPAPDRDRR